MKTIHLIVVLSLIFSPGCHLRLPLYTSDGLRAPLLTEKHEIHGEAAASTNTYDFHLVYAPSDHIGTMLNYSFMHNRNFSDVSPNIFDTIGYEGFHSFYFVEGASGYFTKQGRIGAFDIYALYGIGKINNRYESDFAIIPETADYYKISLQPSAGIKKEYFHCAFTMRVSLIRLYNYKLNEINQPSINFYELVPGVTFKAGSQNFKGIVNMSFSSKSQGYKKILLQNSEDWFPINISFGIQFSLNLKKKDVRDQTVD